MTFTYFSGILMLARQLSKAAISAASLRIEFLRNHHSVYRDRHMRRIS